MKVAILTMFSGLSATYSLVNVVADQIKMLLDAHVAVKVLVSETCPDSERTGIFLSKDIEWVKMTIPPLPVMCMKPFFRRPT